ncbi:hypothetical protein NBE99_04605 [Thermosynechococcus sp. HN-54]|uniref:hypothetical protein n=1 Tax=Thermosynechococcus sp. HN-54 TaxID=2933959 RepID=UPI00202CCBA6|nr:hypothetical protein [Thermosynechococcus sp. HN-54]URR36421.1 hypothetical protein NBE99_04605 [Thermosynechococcus sp. HN-54]
MFYNQLSEKALLSGATGATIVLNLVHSLVESYQQEITNQVREQEITKQVQEQEITKGQQIEARKQERLAEINATQELLIGHLNPSFEERAQAFQKFFEQIDGAITRGDNTQLALLLDAVVKYAQTSPFSQLADLAQVQANLSNPNHVWEL